jgi:hypothetical protein
MPVGEDGDKTRSLAPKFDDDTSKTWRGSPMLTKDPVKQLQEHVANAFH